MKVILVTSPNNGEGRLPTGRLILPNKASSAGIRLKSIELLAKQTRLLPSLQVALQCLQRAFISASNHLWYKIFLCTLSKENINTKPSYKPFVNNGVDIKISNWYALPWRVCFFISQYSLVACMSFCRIEASCTFLPSTLHVCWCHPSSASIQAVMLVKLYGYSFLDVCFFFF